MRDRIFPSRYMPIDENEYKLTKLVMSRRNLRRVAWGGLGVAGISGSEAIFAGVGDTFAKLFNANDQMLLQVSTIGARVAVGALFAATATYALSYIQGKRMYSLANKVKANHPDNPLIGKIKSDRAWDLASDALTVANIVGITIPVIAPFLAVGLPLWGIVKPIDIGFGARMNGEAKAQKRRYEAAHKTSK